MADTVAMTALGGGGWSSCDGEISDQVDGGLESAGSKSLLFP